MWGEEHSMQREEQCRCPEVEVYMAWKKSKGARIAGAVSRREWWAGSVVQSLVAFTLSEMGDH